jgi:hypothetical protein
MPHPRSTTQRVPTPPVPEPIAPIPTARLAPGLRVVRRGLHHLQVGLYDDSRVLLPRTAEVEETLARLLHQRPLDDNEGTAVVLGLLEQHGCLERGPSAAEGRVAVLGGWETPGLPDLGALLAAAGLTLTHSTVEADVVLVQSLGELDRELLDPLVRRRTDHLVLRMVDGGAVLGPFVVPGVTACLRCVDAHRSVLDPDHVAVTSRYRRATSGPRDDGAPDVPDVSLLSLVLSWAARDVVAHRTGREPATFSRTIRFGREPARRQEQEWPRHPDCGCCWPGLNPSSGTIEA